MDGAEGTQKKANEKTQARDHTKHQGVGSSLPDLRSGSQTSDSAGDFGTLLVSDDWISKISALNHTNAASGLLNIDSRERTFVVFNDILELNLA